MVNWNPLWTCGRSEAVTFSHYRVTVTFDETLESNSAAKYAVDSVAAGQEVFFTFSFTLFDQVWCRFKPGGFIPLERLQSLYISLFDAPSHASRPENRHNLCKAIEITEGSSNPRNSCAWLADFSRVPQWSICNCSNPNLDR